MTSILAVRTLHPGGILKEVATKGTTHDVVELLLHELMAVHFMHFFLASANSSLTTQPKIERTLIPVIFDWTELAMGSP